MKKMYSNEEIEDFIDTFRVFGKSVRKCFTEGNCYWFAIILHERFPNGYIMLNPIVNHFAYKLNDKLYDITGCCDKTYEGEWVDWNYYQLSEPQHSKRIKNYCMYKIWE